MIEIKKKISFYYGNKLISYDFFQKNSDLRISFFLSEKMFSKIHKLPCLKEVSRNYGKVCG